MSFYLTHHTSPPQSSFANQRQRHSLPTLLPCASLLSARLPIHIARPKPNADTCKPMKIKGHLSRKEGPVTSWHRRFGQGTTRFFTRPSFAGSYGEVLFPRRQHF